MCFDSINCKIGKADNIAGGSQEQKSRQVFHLALLITTGLLALAFWVGDSQVSADSDLHLTAPAAPYCPPPDGGGPSGGSDGDYDHDPFEGFPEEGPLGPDGRPGPLNKNDRRALWAYTDMYGDDINDALESGDAAAIRDKSYGYYIGRINSAIKKLPDHRGTVYRYAEVDPDILETYGPGTIITRKGFTSTTTDKHMSFFGDVKFIIESKSGKDISEYSKFKDEDEVLIKSGTSFEVKKKYKDQRGRWVIEMTELA